MKKECPECNGEGKIEIDVTAARELRSRHRRIVCRMAELRTLQWYRRGRR